MISNLSKLSTNKRYKTVFNNMDLLILKYHYNILKYE